MVKSLNNPIKKWETYKSINLISREVWDNFIAINDPFICSKFLEVVENIHPEDDFHYFIAKDENGDIIGLAFYYITIYDLLLNYKNNIYVKFIRNLYPGFFKIKLGMTGSMETYGRHFWYNTKALNYRDFSKSLLDHIKDTCKNHQIIIWRDFLENTSEIVLNKELKFVNANHISASKIALDKDETIPTFLSKIKRKHRVFIKKIIKQKNTEKLEVEIVEDYTTIIDALYELYINVNSNSKEFATQPLPKSFFYEIKEKFKSDVKALVIKDANKDMFAFVLMILQKEILNPFLMGIDYTKKKYTPWYQCVWQVIEYSIKNKCKEIDLGVTNFSMKRKMGAFRIENVISLRFRNFKLNFLFSFLLGYLFKRSEK